MFKKSQEKTKKSAKQKNNVFIMDFYWNIKGFQNSTKMSLTHYFTTLWNFPIIQNFEGITVGSIWSKFDGILKLVLTVCKLQSWKFNGLHFTIMWVLSGILMENNEDIGGIRIRIVMPSHSTSI